jgi:hypothetical protein
MNSDTKHIILGHKLTMLSSAVPGAGAAVEGGGSVLLRLPLRAVPQTAGRDEGQLPSGHLPGAARPHPLLHDKVAAVRTEHWIQVPFHDRYVSKRHALKQRCPCGRYKHF